MTVELRDTALVEPLTSSTDTRLVVTHAQKEMILCARLVGSNFLQSG